jgi:exodeoxyribonuclease-5
VNTNALANAISHAVADRRLTVTDLSADQHEAYSAIRTWLASGTATKRTLTLGGYAGSGKSTVVSVLAHELPSPLAFCAFTGKAASVLGRKLAASGISTVARVARIAARPLDGSPRPPESRPYCGTIHGLVYRLCDQCMVEEEHDHTMGGMCREVRSCESEEGRDARVEAAEAQGASPCLACDPPPLVKREGPCTRCGGARYLKRERLDRSYRIIVVDEASMVDDEVLKDLLHYGVPILAVGDHGQLPPVRGVGSLMKSPDLRLEKIHRQAAGNPIIALSARIRETGDIDDRLEDGEHFEILAARKSAGWIERVFPASRLQLDPRTPEGIMGTVCVSWTNRMRCALNEQVRAALGTGTTPPRAGEVLICLRNNAPVYNGMRGILEGDVVEAGDQKARKWKGSVNFIEDRQRAENILMCDAQFLAEKTIDYEAACAMGVSMAKLGHLYDFGYALTCHKMQGSQAHEVAVFVEGGLSRIPRPDRTRWLYTAVTRAAHRLVVIR